ncbi:hypothetical protein [Sphingobacterium athyrii]|uniref:Uncharacterized protein n=1 Tax=Sphingobacterium athyrii TaxID=2152717 RepID=A0A363NLY8_9SPHI|nr:hypothetical protein [Sphingobacterium athyrii]PUV21727.1 hypothetical protein DCO56_25670 [Sphingobacterium athyrii]
MHFQIGWIERGKIMNCRLIYTIGLMCLSSCKLYQQEDRAELQSSRNEWQWNEFAQRWYTLQRDCLSRSWYFSSDSGFRFHPDSGLTAETGELWIQESKTRINTQHQNMTAAIKGSAQNGYRTKQTKNSSLDANYWWFVLLLLIPVVLLWNKIRKLYS